MDPSVLKVVSVVQGVHNGISKVETRVNRRDSRRLHSERLLYMNISHRTNLWFKIINHNLVSVVKRSITILSERLAAIKVTARRSEKRR
jgi:hypothetical protein